MSITLHQGSILDSTADVIVNPANSFLRHGGGLARVIDEAAGTMPIASDFCASGAAPMSVATLKDVLANETLKAEEWHTEHINHSLIATGDVGWTSAGRLPFKGVIHAVGPVWADGHMYERQLLASAYARSIAVAREHGCASIAFPAISAGIFGFPIAEAAQIAVRQVAWFDFEAEFWLFSDEHYAAFEIALMEVPSI